MRWDLFWDVAKMIGVMAVVLYPIALFFAIMGHEIDDMFWRTSSYERTDPRPKLMSYLISMAGIVTLVLAVAFVVVYLWPNGLYGKY